MAFLKRPGTDGFVGAVLDEYARAAEDFCAAVEAFDPQRFEEAKEGPDEHTRTPLAVCRHVGRAAMHYASDLAKALGNRKPWPFDPNDRLHAPADVRPVLEAALQYTEIEMEPLRTYDDPAIEKLTFTMSWGTLYNPEILLEHAICHLLRHRRQLERW